MSYQILRTDKADEQLRDIIFYIADDSGSVDKDFPYSGSVPHYATLRRQGYRVLIVERHLVFYKVNESQQIVTIYAVVDGRREYRKLL